VPLASSLPGDFTRTNNQIHFVKGGYTALFTYLEQPRSKKMIKKLGLISAGTLLLTTQAFALGATQVPEPGPMGLLLVGAASIFVARRFHKNK